MHPSSRPRNVVTNWVCSPSQCDFAGQRGGCVLSRSGSDQRGANSRRPASRLVPGSTPSSRPNAPTSRLTAAARSSDMKRSRVWIPTQRAQSAQVDLALPRARLRAPQAHLVGNPAEALQLWLATFHRYLEPGGNRARVRHQVGGLGWVHVPGGAASPTRASAAASPACPGALRQARAYRPCSAL